MTTRMPVVFFGHGSPMNALADTEVTHVWARIGETMPRPKAILCISAHWETRGVAVTAMEKPRTIHDFGRFPQALFDVQYPAPGDPALAARVAELLAPTPVAMDQDWGLDHGTWSVLCKAWPNADVPVVQLSLDVGFSAAQCVEIGRKLAPLRDEGVLIAGSGNIVHNLAVMDWNAPAGAGYDWADRFSREMHEAIATGALEPVVHFEQFGEPARLSVNSAEHFKPLLYVLGAKADDDSVRFENDHIEYGSLSMTTLVFEPVPKAA
jgi:4,5-DOPA dioxygenase extradiol